MKRMQGYEVFQPMGFDAFGLPAENYAIKTGIHPEDSTLNNIKTMEKQLKDMGATFDWDYKVVTCLPDYYKWTQWLFLKLFEAGLAYRKNAPVNWCTKCMTVLANEQVVDGTCERCEATVTKRNLVQWFFKITNYADELLDKLDTLDWPEKTLKMQKNWIGRSKGAEIEFAVHGRDISFKVFTTRADTLMGVTYVVLAPENPIVEEITVKERLEEVISYRENTLRESEIDRLSTTKEKTGVFTGAYAIHPISGEKVQIWIADYVLSSYGTGCVMAVPAHDERDYEFAKKYNLEIRRVIRAKNQDSDAKLPFIEDGIMTESGLFNDMTSQEGRNEIIKKLESIGKGSERTNYRLRDWLVSRQRYWGAPIPIIHCECCGTVPVPLCDLPVKLPYNVEFNPDGESPLARSDEFMNVICPKCGKDAKRDADTLDTFVCSSWYYLRYPDNQNEQEPFDKEWINKILPVDKYIGGPEHATMHLLYARFITKALRDIGYLNFDEPFTSLVHQGIILGPDGNRMSKSKGNIISPDEYIKDNGSDVFRLYLMFGFSYSEGGPWNDDGLKAISKFLARIERIVEKIVEMNKNHLNQSSQIGKNEKELSYVLNHTIKGVTEDGGKFQFNTSIARLMELVNAMYKYESASLINLTYYEEVVKTLIKIIAPFAPHFAEDMWQELGLAYSVHNQIWPQYKEEELVKDTIEIAVQVNSKIKHKISIDSSLNEKEVEEVILKNHEIMAFVGDKTIKNVIVIKGRLVNIICN
jgi:leucyl-tRNA synthetase